MPSLPEPLLLLISSLAKLPGIGPRSAERIALHVVQADPEFTRRLAQSILDAREKIRPCQECGGLTENQPCPICSDSRRDPALLCVVEHPTDIFILEKAGSFHGKYHVLGGKLSPLGGIEPEDLRIAELESRLAPQAIREVILALGTDVEGDATAYYLAKRLAPAGPRITRLAHGLPAGSGLEFADELTLTHAIDGRRELNP
jgi:recombination protein RecR